MYTEEKMTIDEGHMYFRIMKKRNQRAWNNKGAGSRQAGLSMVFKSVCEAGK